MGKIIIGVDPDSSKHGVAVYLGGVLRDLHSLELPDFVGLLEFYFAINGEIEIHIEDVTANNATFRKKFVKNDRAEKAVTRSVGKCQQAQIELERFVAKYELKLVRHKISNQWKNQAGKKIFEKVTGWKGRSNEDTRSAAYFGFLGLNITGRG
jgi:hypothetical protein